VPEVAGPREGEGRPVTAMYVYLHSEPRLWTVGFYDPSGVFQPESDHDSSEDAAKRVAWLNGSKPEEGNR
jgi:hypothetical protein